MSLLHSSRAGWLWAVSLMCLAAVTLARADQGSGAAQAEADANCTVITSDRLSFDQQQRTAIFEDNVVVVDPQLKITAHKLTTFFSEDNKMTLVEALGEVVIRQGEKQARGAAARYEVDANKFVLSGYPVVRQGRDVLSAETITFWRNSDRIVCEPHARLVLSTGPGLFEGGLSKE